MIILIKGSGKTFFCNHLVKLFARYKHFRIYDDVQACQIPHILRAIRYGRYPVFVLTSTDENIDKWEPSFRKVLQLPVFVLEVSRFDR